MKYHLCQNELEDEASGTFFSSRVIHLKITHEGRTGGRRCTTMKNYSRLIPVTPLTPLTPNTFQQLLTLHKRGYETLSGSVDKQARDFSRILQERRTQILQGERASLWQILEMLQDTGKRMGSLISQKLFFEIVHEIIKNYDSFTLMVSLFSFLNY